MYCSSLDNDKVHNGSFLFDSTGSLGPYTAVGVFVRFMTSHATIPLAVAAKATDPSWLPMMALIRPIVRGKRSHSLGVLGTVDDGAATAVTAVAAVAAVATAPRLCFAARALPRLASAPRLQPPLRAAPRLASVPRIASHRRAAPHCAAAAATRAACALASPPPRPPPSPLQHITHWPGLRCLGWPAPSPALAWPAALACRRSMGGSCGCVV